MRLEACHNACRLGPQHVQRCGKCYEGAYEHVQRFGGRLVHGTVRSLLLGRRIQHAWVESGAKVFDYADPTVVRVTTAAAYQQELAPRADPGAVVARYGSGDARGAVRL